MADRDERLWAYQIRLVRFSRAPRWRGGLDPDEVYAYVAAIAAEVDRLGQDLAVARGENDRLRAALLRWQRQHAHCHRRGPANQGAWGGVRW
nr:cell division protein DivIVA [Micromonospora sp. DSM 115978]